MQAWQHDCVDCYGPSLHLVHVAAEELIVTLEPLHELFGWYHTSLLLAGLDLQNMSEEGVRACKPHMPSLHRTALPRRQPRLLLLS